MDVNEINIGIPTAAALASSLISGLSIWYRLKHKVDLKELKIKRLEEKNADAHKRVEDLKNKHEALSKEFHEFEKNTLRSK